MTGGSVTAYTDRLSNDPCAVVVLFDASHEIGLWVVKSTRRHGVGTAFFARAVDAVDHALLYASVAHSNPHGRAMNRILMHTDFSPCLSTHDHTVWRRITTRERHDADQRQLARFPGGGSVRFGTA